MKNKYPIQVIDLRYQVDHITPNEFNCLRNLILVLLMLMLDYLLY